ncbi:MAG: hypothetical protein P8I31_02850 [Bacteroidia bacterium]|nr:hypothetical protein [Bacteroidia bacterium]
MLGIILLLVLLIILGCIYINLYPILAERAGPSDTFIVSDCLSGELYHGLDDYLAYEYYIEKNSTFFWEIESKDNDKLFRDNCANYWKQRGTSVVLSDENGCSIEGEYSIHILIDQEKNIKGYLNVDYEYQIEPGPLECRFIVYHKITDEHGVEIAEHDVEFDTYYGLHELEQQLEEDERYISTNKHKCTEVEPLKTPVLFKHGHSLLDGRNLSEKCWFKKYHVTDIDDDEYSEFDELTIYQPQNIDDEGTALDRHEMPYLWWLTNNIPHKDGYMAFQDVHGNAFYVGNKKNVGEVIVYKGKPVDNKKIVIDIIFNGYFDINDNTVRLEYRDINASGFADGKQFTIIRGSIFKYTMSIENEPDKFHIMLDYLIENKIVKSISNERYRFSKNHTFNSKTEATSLLYLKKTSPIGKWK